MNDIKSINYTVKKKGTNKELTRLCEVRGLMGHSHKDSLSTDRPPQNVLVSEPTRRVQSEIFKEIHTGKGDSQK